MRMNRRPGFFIKTAGMREARYSHPRFHGVNYDVREPALPGSRGRTLLAALVVPPTRAYDRLCSPLQSCSSSGKAAIIGTCIKTSLG